MLTKIWYRVQSENESRENNSHRSRFTELLLLQSLTRSNNEFDIELVMYVDGTFRADQGNSIGNRNKTNKKV